MGASPDQEVVELEELYKMAVRAYVLVLSFQSYSSFLAGSGARPVGGRSRKSHGTCLGKGEFLAYR